MKLNAKSLLLTIVVTASLGALVSCGGTDPNDSAVAAVTPTCKIKSNWLLLQTGYTIENTVRVLGQPNATVISGNSITYNYEDCRIITIFDGTANVNLPIPGSVSFLSGYLVSINSPKDVTRAVVYEYTDAEVMAYQRGQ